MSNIMLVNSLANELNDNNFVSGECRIYHLWRCTNQQNAAYSRLQTSLRELLQLYIQLRGWYLPLKKFIVVYKIVGYCTNIYICMFIRKEPSSEKLTCSLNPGRWDLDAPDPGPWLNIILDKYTCTKIRLFLTTPIHLNTKCIDISWQRHATSSTAGGGTGPLIVHLDSHFVYWFWLV